tara:strand:- start:745 stop:2688 length:1944 start_codon:yes stop_codon:yes gene_type:complete
MSGTVLLDDKTFMEGAHPREKKYNEQLYNANMKYNPANMWSVYNPKTKKYEVLDAAEGRRRAMEGDTSVYVTRYQVNKDGKRVPDPNWYNASSMYHTSGGQYQTKKNLAHNPPKGEFRTYDKENNVFRQYKTRDSKNYEGTTKDGSDLGWGRLNPEISMSDQIHSTERGGNFALGYGGVTEGVKQKMASLGQLDEDDNPIISAQRVLRDKDGNYVYKEDGTPAIENMSNTHYQNINSEVSNRTYGNKYGQPKNIDRHGWRYDQAQVAPNTKTGAPASGQFVEQVDLAKEKGMHLGKEDKPNAAMVNFGDNPVYYNPKTQRQEVIDKNKQIKTAQSDLERINKRHRSFDEKNIFGQIKKKGRTQRYIDNISGEGPMDETYTETDSWLFGKKQKGVQKPYDAKNFIDKNRRRKVDKTKLRKKGYIRKIKGPDINQKIINGEVVWDRERDGGKLINALRKLTKKRKEDQSQKEVDEAIRLDKKMPTEIPTKTTTDLPKRKEPKVSVDVDEMDKLNKQKVGKVSVDFDEMDKLNKPTPAQSPTTTGKTKETKTRRVKEEKQPRQRRERKPREKIMTSSNKLRGKISDAFRRKKGGKERKGLNLRRATGGDLFGTIKRKLAERKARRASRKGSGGGLFGKFKLKFTRKGSMS